MLNALLEGYRLTINGVDCTAAIDGDRWCSLSVPKISETGLYPTTGDLVLLPIQGFATDFFSPRKNRSQWQRGNSVIVEVVFSGVYERLFTGLILNRPATPTVEQPQLVIPVGCELAYRDREAVAGDRAEVKLGELTDRGEIIRRILSATGFTGSWTGVIPEHPIAYPLPKHTGSYVAQVAAIAASASYGLYCDRLGNINAVKQTLAPEILFSRSSDRCLLSPLDGSEAPAYEVQATATGRTAEPLDRVKEYEPSLEYGLAGTFTSNTVIQSSDSNDTSSSSTTNRYYGTNKRTVITEFYSDDNKKHTLKTRIDVNDFTLLERGIFRLIPSQEEVMTEKYSSGKDGKLIEKTTALYSRPIRLKKLFESWSQFMRRPLIESKRTVETWTYEDNTVSKYQAHKYLLFINLNQNSIYLASRTTVTYTELGSGQWRKVVEDEVLNREGQRFLISNLRVLEYFPQLFSRTDKSGTFVGEENRPQEPRRHPPFFTAEEVTYSGAALFGGIGQTTEPAKYDFDYGVSDAQASELAAYHGAVRVGRDAGWLCTAELHEYWLKNWTPAAGAAIALPDGDIGLFLIDGLSIDLSASYGLISFALVELGTIGAISPGPPDGQVLSYAD